MSDFIVGEACFTTGVIPGIALVPLVQINRPFATTLAIGTAIAQVKPVGVKFLAFLYPTPKV
jgi:hypothetical protein